ncbi:diacylglycerol/polyprenol kinase family protein [Thermosynechococcus sp.]|uniref:diacylglycerol/polyprenol kinase family protein n=1 Tax=Thermosynechococcus sp. TaxID=2814275 RepID=UPI00391A1D14
MTMVWAGVLVTSWLGLVLLTAELIHAWFPNAKEWSRKVVHIGAGQVILIAYALGVPTSWGIVAAAVAGVITVVSHWVPIFPSISAVGRQSWGTFFYAVSIGTLMGLFWDTLPQLAILGILVMAWGDGLAALVGMNWGRHPLPGTAKSWEGTLTMFSVSTVVAALSLHSLAPLEVVWMAPLVGGGATLLELIAWRGIDNLTVPIGSALLAYGLLNLS